MRSVWTLFALSGAVLRTIYLYNSGGAIFNHSRGVKTTPFDVPISLPARRTHSKGTLTGPDQPKTRRDISSPVSYEPPFTAWSLPAGSTVVFMIYHFAGQSTLHDNFSLILSNFAVSECPQCWHS